MHRTAIRITVLLAFLGGLSFSPAPAGTGGIDGDKLDLSVTFAYREADIEAWRPLFEETSRLLYNATNGQLQLGRVRIETCGLGQEDADIWILDGQSGAFANVLGLGGVGHIYLSQTHRDVDGPAFGQFGLVHEFGHYAFGLYDEYKGITPPPPPLFARAVEQTGLPVPNQFCVTDDHTIACVMDGGTLVFPNNGRTEFCTHAHGGLSTAHNEGTQVDSVDYVNAQQALNGESCWETILRTVGLFPPVEVDPDDPAGLDPIDWEIVPSINRIVLCIDGSVSMFDPPGSIGLAKEAADLLAALLHGRKRVEIDEEVIVLPGEHLAVVSFAHEERLEWAFREIENEETRRAARAAIEAVERPIVPASRATDLGAGLGASLRQILEEGDVAACGEAIVLLSDGGHNFGAGPEEWITPLRERGVAVHAIALGDRVDRDAALPQRGDPLLRTGAEVVPAVGEKHDRLPASRHV
ncbi:MAG: VWA domain-containing protein, partial [Candidatus Eisenbacteria bacterium]|nr:VWA domain-containing protein [Candidatus Latescibacterota bacterium]MBD3301708.1 VWA domain-containing protein [Candidatus Eisenbacteria bacterium]